RPRDRDTVPLGAGPLGAGVVKDPVVSRIAPVRRKDLQTSMQLSRILTAPIVVDVRRGAVAGLGALLADQRIATEGRVAVAVGPSQGDSVLADLDLGQAEV